MKALEVAPPSHLWSEINVRWEVPTPGWVKLKGNHGIASCRGLIRDAHGEWLGGFATNLGISSSPIAELWAIINGLELAWVSGY